MNYASKVDMNKEIKSIEYSRRMMREKPVALNSIPFVSLADSSPPCGHRRHSFITKALWFRPNTFLVWHVKVKDNKIMKKNILKRTWKSIKTMAYDIIKKKFPKHDVHQSLHYFHNYLKCRNRRDLKPTMVEVAYNYFFTKLGFLPWRE